MKTPIIEFKDFGFRYTAQAEPTLYNINLRLYEGEKVLICGPSGCGKSTLAHCINGLIPSAYEGEATGELWLGGQDFRKTDVFSLSKLVGTVLQDSDAQFIGLTVGEDISFALENDAVPTDEMHRRVAEAAARVGMESFLAHAPHELSGGQKQRVSLAGVMVDNVRVLLFDEPLANLDPAAGKSTIELIDDIHKNTGAAVIIIEHRLEDVLHRDVDRVILMGEGRILADVTPDELLCSDLLRDNGIREPLYITALKYAGVTPRPELRPGRIDTLRLAPEDIALVREWFRRQPPEESPAGREPLLSAENISFTYKGGHRALSGVSLAVKRGEMIGIVGRNGAGKSTFAKIVCGFETPQEGSVSLAGENLADYSIKERAEHIGYVMQNPNQMITQTGIFDEVALGLRLRGRLSEEEISARVNETLQVCGLYPFRRWPVSALSYGQKKRVTIASILAIQPEIIILDEPTAGQDFRHYTEIMEFLRELNARGITILLVTHDMHLMLEYCERAAVFTDGEKLADTDCAAILTDAALVEKASLKETSLSRLAALCELDGRELVRRFIQYDREVRAV